MLRKIVSSTLVVRAVSLGARSRGWPRGPPLRCAPLSTAEVPARVRDLGSVIAREAGAAVVRGNSVSGEISEVGSRTRFADGAEGTVVVERSALAIAAVDDAAGASLAAVGSDVVVLRNDTRLAADATAKLTAGAVIDSRAPGLGEGVEIFGEGLEATQMSSIDEHMRTGFGAIDMLTPLGWGQSVLLVGAAASLEARRQVALGTLASQPAAVTTIYACLDPAAEAEVARLLSDRSYPSDSRKPTLVVARPQATEFAGDVEAAYTAHVALALAHDVRTRHQGDTILVLDGLNVLARLWRSTTTLIVDNDRPVDAASDEAECRGFFAQLLQNRLGQARDGGSITVIALCSEESVEAEAEEALTKKKKKKEEEEDVVVYSLEDFEKAGARESILARLRALAGRGIALTPDVLTKIDVAEPVAAGRRKRRTRSPLLEMLTSVADAHVEVAVEGAAVVVDIAGSLQRVGVGGAETKGGDPRCAALKRLGVGHQLRLELLSADADANPVQPEAGDLAKMRRAEAWRAALKKEAVMAPTPLSDLVVLASAIRLGLADHCGGDVAETRKVVDGAIAAARADAGQVLDAVDATMDLSADQAATLGKALAKLLNKP